MTLTSQESNYDEEKTKCDPEITISQEKNPFKRGF